MKFNTVKISSKSQGVFTKIKSKTGVPTNVLARFAICLSIKEKSIPNPDEFNENGSIIEPNILFGEHEQIYLALMLNRLKNDKLDPTIYLNKMLRTHINRGAIALGPRINNLSDFYGLVIEERNV